ncbi:MAG: hypothetical protein ABL927_09045 [Bdellovibrionales bacterium]
MPKARVSIGGVALDSGGCEARLSIFRELLQARAIARAAFTLFGFLFYS